MRPALVLGAALERRCAGLSGDEYVPSALGGHLVVGAIRPGEAHLDRATSGDESRASSDGTDNWLLVAALSCSATGAARSSVAGAGRRLGSVRASPAWPQRLLVREGLSISSQVVTPGSLFALRSLTHTPIRGPYWLELTDLRTRAALVDRVCVGEGAQYPVPVDHPRADLECLSTGADDSVALRADLYPRKHEQREIILVLASMVDFIRR